MAGARGDVREALAPEMVLCVMLRRRAVFKLFFAAFSDIMPNSYLSIRRQSCRAAKVSTGMAARVNRGKSICEGADIVWKPNQHTLSAVERNRLAVRPVASIGRMPAVYVSRTSSS